MKCIRQRCQVALNILEHLGHGGLDALMASERTSLTSRRPRRTSLRRNTVQNVSASDPPPAPSAFVRQSRSSRSRDRRRGSSPRACVGSSRGRSSVVPRLRWRVATRRTAGDHRQAAHPQRCLCGSAHPVGLALPTYTPPDARPNYTSMKSCR
jgi:hypothetical protein